MDKGEVYEQPTNRLLHLSRNKHGFFEPYHQAHSPNHDHDLGGV